MKKIILILLLNLPYLIIAQSWMITTELDKVFQAFEFPLELKNNHIFSLHTSISTFFDQRVLLELRSKEGRLIKSNEFIIENRTLDVQNASVLGDKVALVFSGYPRKIINPGDTFDLSYHFIVLNQDLEITAQSDMFDLGHRELHKISLWPDSDSTILVSFNLPAAKYQEEKNYFLQYSDKGEILKLNNTFYEHLGPKAGHLYTNHRGDSILGRFSDHSFYYFNDSFEPVFRFEKILKTFRSIYSTMLSYYPDNTFLFLETYDYRINPYQAAIVKYNSEFKQIKVTPIGGPLIWTDPGEGKFYNPQAHNSMYIVGVGWTPTTIDISNPLTVSRLDTNMNILWTKIYEDGQYYENPKIYATQDDGLLIGGTRKIPFEHNFTAYLLKIDSTGRFPTGTDEVQSKVKLNMLVYPNPSSGMMGIQIDEMTDEIQLELHNMNGAKVFGHRIDQSGHHQFNFQHLPAGQYLYSIYSKGELKAQGYWQKQE